MDAFTKLTTKLTNPSLSVKDKLKEVCLITAAQIKGAHRVSLWIFGKNFDSIEPLICYDATNHTFPDGQVLNQSDYKEYFDGVLQNEVVCASDARNHELTKCFNESYFEPLNIYSLLDYILHRDFEPQGVICCESIGNITDWSEQDIETLKRIARASSMYFKYDE